MPICSTQPKSESSLVWRLHPLKATLWVSHFETILQSQPQSFGKPKSTKLKWSETITYRVPNRERFQYEFLSSYNHMKGEELQAF